MSTIVTRVGKGSPLTFDELDANFTNLNTDKYQAGNNVALGTIAGSTITSSALTSGRVIFASASGLLTDNANLTWDNANNRLGIGTASPIFPLTIYSTTSAVASIYADNTQGSYRVYGYGSSGMANGFIRHGGTFASPTAVSSGSSTGTFNFQAFGGTTTVITSQIQNFVSTYTADNDISGFMTLSTRPTGLGASLTERMRIHASGGVSIGNTTDSGAASLNVSGLIYPQQASTAPTYVKGAIYFDTTLNKLRVGGATAWETITSV
jgi:hypothetical protein